MERACSELVRCGFGQVRFIAIATDLSPELETLVDRWIRIRVPRRPFFLSFLLFFIGAGIAVRREHAELVHTIGAIIPNRVTLAAVHYCHAGARQALGGLAPRDAPFIRRINTGLAHALALLAERWCYRSERLRQFAPVSSGVAAELALYYPGVPCVTVPNGVDTEGSQIDPVARRASRLAEGASDEDLVALFIGGDWDRKGLAIAIEGLAAARSADIPAWLWVVGSGDKGRFARIAEARGVNGCVRFFGHQSNTDRYYQSADVFVLPSLYETFSLGSYEAAAFGLPIVATAVSGVAELIGDDEAGIVVSRNGSDVGAALNRLGHNSELRYRLGGEAQRRARSYTWSGSSRKMLDLYRDLLDRTP
jgi:glycosyltransferase involved in cell wall biosynthesis